MSVKVILKSGAPILIDRADSAEWISKIHPPESSYLIGFLRIKREGQDVAEFFAADVAGYSTVL